MISGLLIVAPTARELAGAQRVARTAVVGIGKISLDQTRDAIATHRPALLLSIGFSGALDPALRTGDIVVSKHIVEPEGTKDLVLSAAHADAAIRTLLNARFTVSDSPTLTTPRPVLTANEKARLAHDRGAASADMETLWIATAAARANVPMLSVRTVIDQADENLPHFVSDIMADGGHHERRHSLLALRNPANIGGLIRMAVHARKATIATRAMLGVLLPALAEQFIATETAR